MPIEIKLLKVWHIDGLPDVGVDLALLLELWFVNLNFKILKGISINSRIIKFVQFTQHILSRMTLGC